MTLPLFLAVLNLAAVTPKQHVIVYGVGQSDTFGAVASAPAPAAKPDAAFFHAFVADLAHPAPFAPVIPLGDFPVYGKDVPGAHGEVQYHPTFKGGFVAKVAIEGLTPGHPYILCLNGNPEKLGNDRLMTPVPGNEKERYFDFQHVTAGADGRYVAEYAIKLPPGPYQTRFYVKDQADFKIILYHDFFPFTVE